MKPLLKEKAKIIVIVVVGKKLAYVINVVGLRQIN